MSLANIAKVEVPSEIAAFAGYLESLLTRGKQSSAVEVSEVAANMLASISREYFADYADLLNRACFFLFEVNHSSHGIALGKEIAAKAKEFSNIQVQRRISNILGGQYGDIADFASAMEYLELAIVLARTIGDELIEAACIANVVAVLQEMGHYRQAISMAEKVLKIKDDSLLARMLKLQCASSGLFSAHRTGDLETAAKFLKEGESYLSGEVDPLRRVFFEKDRAFYLADQGRVDEAKALLAETIRSTAEPPNPRIRALLTIASAVCSWAAGDVVQAREELRTLYIESKKSRLYHHSVLQALVKVYGDSATPEQAAEGMSYARELVEYTTSVKKAKFYRQLANRRSATEARASSLNGAASTSIDPFDMARDWLRTSDIKAPPEEGGERRLLDKHEELTAIHEDMAKLRAMSIRRDIRTDAVDTAENWAIAAEFFDDETGQHCYRVGHLASMLAREIGMNETFCVQVEHAARLHDIGKIAVNEVILLKPGPLDAAEMAAMRLHTEVGAQILAGSDDPVLKMAVEVARHHHEWWNGAGYPTKLSGRNIPLSARVCAYADVYDALTHMRAYKQAWTHERALEEIVRLGGTQFDPDLLGPFIAVLERYRADLDAQAIPGFADMNSNALIASRRKLMETIGAGSS
jgi:putative nucleotidyltransferase with HDIG domain